MWEDYPEMESFMDYNDNMLANYISNMTMQEINVPVVIPVVFHVMEGVGSISDSEIQGLLMQINDDFSSTSGTNLDITFCMAKQHPDGTPIFPNGILRVNASSVSGYIADGISPSNELALKSLSILDTERYLNIWIVHDILDVGQQTYGYAYLASNHINNTDGVVIVNDVAENPDFRSALTHEVGHYFNLLHTFQGDCPSGVDCSIYSNLMCPANTQPYSDGDHCADTPPHKRYSGLSTSCDENAVNNCSIPNNPNFNLAHNHMNYTPSTCRSTFTDDQMMRVHAAIEMFRSGLLYSIGCSPPCNGDDVTFNMSLSNEIVVGDEITFESTTVGYTYYDWTVNNLQVSSAEIYTHEFENSGVYEVCLTVLEGQGSSCVLQNCTNIYVTPFCLEPENPCNVIQNSEFELNSIGNLGTQPLNQNGIEQCGWISTASSPDYCYQDNDYISIYASDSEAFGTDYPVPFEDGEEYTIIFDYRTGCVDAQIKVGFYDNDEYNTYENNHSLYLSNFQFDSNTNSNAGKCMTFNYNDFLRQKTLTFIYDDSYGNYLNIETSQSANVGCKMNIDNFYILKTSCSPYCQPAPSILAEGNECDYKFTAINNGDPGSIQWNISDGSVYYDNIINHEFLTSGTYEVTLAIDCGDNVVSETNTIIVECERTCEQISTSARICDNTIIPLTNRVYLGSVDIGIPKGAGICEYNELSLPNEDAVINVMDSHISTSDPINDIITINYEVRETLELGLNNTLSTSLRLCDKDGNILCYELIIDADDSCDNCLGEITATAICADPNPFDDEYVYEGSVNLTLPSNGGPYTECDPVSTETGYEQVPNINGNNIIIDYSINTDTEGDFNASSLLCFDGENIGQVCYTFKIKIVSCPPSPDCIDWRGKISDATDCRVVDGQVIYTVNMDNVWLFGTGYNECESGNLQVYLDGGDDISLNSGSVNGGYLSYSSQITMPCGFDANRIYELVITACDQFGNPVCFIFDIRFPDCDVDCKDGDIRGRSSSHLIDNATVQLYPNPVKNDVTISVENARSMNHRVLIYDRLGRLVTDLDMLTNIRLDLGDLQSGIYFVKVTDVNGNLIGLEKLIILK